MTDMTVAHCRALMFDKQTKRVLIACLHGSNQENDLTLPPNCGGFGRIHHFRRFGNDRWVENPLPIDPAALALGTKPLDVTQVQLFQCAACNFDCWYCFVPKALRSGDSNTAQWFTADELVDLYMQEDVRQPIIDLSGGNPGLIPEWIDWMMLALERRGMSDKSYLWSDDNLTTDVYWRELPQEVLRHICGYRNHGKVGCFKGYTSASFAFNTGMKASMFDAQFEIMSYYKEIGLDLYGYVTFTTPSLSGVETSMAAFVDKLSAIHELFPLRTIPLEVKCYAAIDAPLTPIRQEALNNQYVAVDVWRQLLRDRYGSACVCSSPTAYSMR